MKSTLLTTGPLFELQGLQVQPSLNKHAVMITEYLILVDYLLDQLTGPSGLLLSSLVLKSQDLEPARHQNQAPTFQEMATTIDPKQTERRSLLQSGRREARPKLSTRKPDFLRERSMPNVMERGRRSLRAFKQNSMPNVMVMPASQRSLNGVSVRTFKSDSEPLKRRSSLNGVSEQTFKSDSERLERRSSLNAVSERTSKSDSERLERRSSLNAVSERTSKSDVEHLKRRSSLNAVSERTSKSDSERLKRRSSLNGASERTFKSDSEHLKRRSSIGQTVTIAKFLEDDSRNRVKSCRVEAADATSIKATTCLPVHKWKAVSTTAHATRRPVVPKKAFSQRPIAQSRESGTFAVLGSSAA